MNVVNSTLTMLENSLKQISDEMFEAQKALPGRENLPDKENRELMGVMRVGALAASTGTVRNLRSPFLANISFDFFYSISVQNPNLAFA